MFKKLEKINALLIEKFGIPFIAETPPDPLDLLIATILSQNTNDNNSFKAFQNLKQQFPEWGKVLKAPLKKLEDTIRIAGLAQQKAAAIKSLLNYLNEQKNELSLEYLRSAADDQILNELTEIKGIGIKTASCLLLFSFLRDVCPVDTHVHRVLNRIGIVKTTSPEKTFFNINKKIPGGVAHQLHTNLIRLGREICKPAVPVCYECPLKRICKYPAKDFAKKVTGKGKNFFLLDNV
jgi:endonuclease III